MKILYVDMDGVLADFDKGVMNIEAIPWDEDNVNRVCEANPRLFSTLPDIEGGVDAVYKLLSYFEIYFLSTPMYNVPESYMDKRIWLREKFGPWADKRLILTHRKDLNEGDFLVDDRTKNGAGEFKGELILFGSEKFPNWKEVKKYLMKNK